MRAINVNVNGCLVPTFVRFGLLYLSTERVTERDSTEFRKANHLEKTIFMHKLEEQVFYSAPRVWLAESDKGISGLRERGSKAWWLDSGLLWGKLKGLVISDGLP